MSFRALLALAALAGVGATSAACRRAPSSSSSGPPPPATTASAPADRLAPGETPPGIERAFDLLLPRGAQITGRFPDTIDAVIALPAEDVANAVRAQSDGPTEARVGASGTVFPELHVVGGEPGHHLHVTVGSEAGRTTLSVLRVEERPPPEAEPPAQAMQKAGLNPDGTLIHPELRQ